MFRLLCLGLVVLGLAFWWLTQPQTADTRALGYSDPDPVNGELMFHAGSCAACHESDLRGGLELQTDFGTFRVPNISPDRDSGIGDWSDTDFIDAMQYGVSPEGKHYYPAFPYASYARMQVQDVVDLKAYIDTLPPIKHEVAGHELAFPWSVSRGIGLWKRLYLDASPQIELAADADTQLLRGRYLVEGPGHCAECHTARDAFGGIRADRWLAGAPNPDGDGQVPNITPDQAGLGGWSTRDIEFYLESGFTPDFDTVGGSMVKVQENMARLPPEDRAAIVAYLQAIPARPKSE